MAIYYIAFFIVTCALTVILRAHPKSTWWLFRALLGLSALPYLVLVYYLWRYISGYGVYPGLIAFATAGIFLTMSLLAFAAWLASRVPIATALLPVVLGGGFWYGLFPLLQWDAPEVVLWDNMPLIWLAGFSVLASVCMAATAAFVFRRRLAFRHA